jgi:phage-related protein
LALGRQLGKKTRRTRRADIEIARRNLAAVRRARLAR